MGVYKPTNITGGPHIVTKQTCRDTKKQIEKACVEVMEKTWAIRNPETRFLQKPFGYLLQFAMVKPWPIEIDGLPINSMVIFHGYVK